MKEVTILFNEETGELSISVKGSMNKFELLGLIDQAMLTILMGKIEEEEIDEEITEEVEAE